MSEFTPKPINYYHLFVKPVLPLVYDEALSYLETLGQVVVKLNEVISWANEYTDQLYAYVDEKAQENLNELLAQLNTYKSQIEAQLAGYDGRLTNVENQLNSQLTTINSIIAQFQQQIDNQLAGFQLQYQSDINQFKAETTQQLQEQNAQVQASILANTAYVNAQISTLTSLINLKSDENKQYTDSEIQKLKDSIPNLTDVNVIYPGNSLLVSIQEAVNLLYHELSFFTLTANEYDTLDLTAEAYDTWIKGNPDSSLSAQDYDLYGKWYLIYSEQGGSGGDSLPTGTNGDTLFYLNGWKTIKFIGSNPGYKGQLKVFLTNGGSSGSLTLPVSGFLAPANGSGQDKFLKFSASNDSVSEPHVEWDNIPKELPEGGTAGQVLTKTTTGTIWKDAPSGGDSIVPTPEDTPDLKILVSQGGELTWSDIPGAMSGNSSPVVFVPASDSDITAPSKLLECILPTAIGETGQVLTKTSSGAIWQDSIVPPPESKERNQYLSTPFGTDTPVWKSILPVENKNSSSYFLGSTTPTQSILSIMEGILPSATGITGQVFTKNAGGADWADPPAAQQVWSTTPQKIGTWIDGKDRYRCVVHLSNLNLGNVSANSYSMYTITTPSGTYINSPPLSTIIFKGSFIIGDDTITVPGFNSKWEVGLSVAFAFNSYITRLHYKNLTSSTANFTITEGYIIIEYTAS